MTAPALQVKPAEYIGIGARSVAQPAGGNNWYRLLFYNIGWNKDSKKKRNTQSIWPQRSALWSIPKGPMR